MLVLAVIVHTLKCATMGVRPRPDESLAALLTRELAEAQLVPHGVQAIRMKR